MCLYSEVFSFRRDDKLKQHSVAPSADSLGLAKTTEPPQISIFPSLLLSDYLPELLPALHLSGYYLLTTDPDPALQDSAPKPGNMGNGSELPVHHFPQPRVFHFPAVCCTLVLQIHVFSSTGA